MEKHTAGQMICSYRERANLTQEELAAIINVTKGKLDHWETDVTIPRPSMLTRLADALKLSDAETKMLITAIAEAKAKRELEQTAERALLAAQTEEEIRLEHEGKALKLFWMGAGGFLVGLLICFISGAWRDFPWYGPIAIGIMIAGIPYGWTLLTDKSEEYIRTPYHPDRSFMLFELLMKVIYYALKFFGAYLIGTFSFPIVLFYHAYKAGRKGSLYRIVMQFFFILIVLFVGFFAISIAMLTFTGK